MNANWNGVDFTVRDWIALGLMATAGVLHFTSVAIPLQAPCAGVGLVLWFARIED